MNSVDQFGDLSLVLDLVVVTFELAIDCAMSGRIQAVSEKYSILRSISDIGTPSRSACETIRSTKNSFASREVDRTYTVRFYRRVPRTRPTG